MQSLKWGIGSKIRLKWTVPWWFSVFVDQTNLKIIWKFSLSQYRCLWTPSLLTHPWPFSKSKFNLRSDRVNLIAPASPIECLLYLPNVRAIQYKLGPERLTRLGNSNVLRLLVVCRLSFQWCYLEWYAQQLQLYTVGSVENYLTLTIFFIVSVVLNILYQIKLQLKIINF